MRTLKPLWIILFSFFLQSVFAIGYKNPVISGFHPDPSICRVGDDYYLVTSTFEYFPGVPIFHSKDLVNWTKIGHCLTRPSQLDLEGCKVSGGIYAPTLRYHDGRFYMITTNLSGKGNFLVHTTDPAGEWSEPVWLEQKGIDPSLNWEDGKCYMVSNPNDEIMLCEINPLTGEQLTESTHIWSGTGGRFPEAPHIYKKDNMFYLIVSEGGTQYGHKVTIARSRKITGPYSENPANPILTHADNITKRNPIQGVGHADFIEAHDGSWWLVALGFRPVVYRHHILGRETYLAPVTWPKDSWPIVNGTGTIDLNMDVETLPIVPKKLEASRDDFDSSNFGLEWNWLRNPDMRKYNLSDKKGHLRLYASNIPLTALASPSFIARRQDAVEFTATTKISLPNKKQEIETGLTVFMNDKHHYKIAVKEDSNNKKSIILTYQLGMLEYTTPEIPINIDQVYFKVEGCSTHYSFYYSFNNKDFKLVKELDTRYLSSETAGGFTGVYLGTYAISSNNEAYADIDWFDYIRR